MRDLYAAKCRDMRFSKNRHKLSACKGVGHGLFQKIKIADERIGLFFGIILMHGYEIDVFPIEKLTYIFEIGGKRVVAGKGDDDGAIASKLCLCRHGDGTVRDARCKLGEGISRAGGNDEHIEYEGGTDGLGFHNGVQNLVAADLLHGADGILRRSEARVRCINAFIHDWQDLISLCREIS